MTDRELLEKAANAAGYWSCEFNCPDRLPNVGWNPLTNDGDAMRLAVQLRLGVDPWGAGRCTVVFTGKDMEQVREPHGGDAHAATRRAIVRAAAERARS